VLAAAYVALAEACTDALRVEEVDDWLDRAELALRERPTPRSSRRPAWSTASSHWPAARRPGRRALPRRPRGARAPVPDHALAEPLGHLAHARAAAPGDRATVRAMLAADGSRDGGHRPAHRPRPAASRRARPGGAAGVLAGLPTADALHVDQAIESRLLAALAHERLAERAAAERSLERALDLAEPDGRARLILDGRDGVRALLERHPRHTTSHAAFVAELLDRLEGRPAPAAPQEPVEPLSERELRVLRYLPTNLTMAEIASELIVSTNTVKTHVRSVYAKLRVHRRTRGGGAARELGLMAPAAPANAERSR